LNCHVPNHKKEEIQRLRLAPDDARTPNCSILASDLGQAQQPPEKAAGHEIGFDGAWKS